MHVFTDQEMDKAHLPTERVQLGLKVLNYKDGVLHPLSLRFIDTPGQYVNLQKSSPFAFEKPD